MARKVPEDREEQSLLGEESCERKLGFAALTPQARSWGVVGAIDPPKIDPSKSWRTAKLNDIRRNVH